MTEIRIVNSGSVHGNGYIIKSDDEILVLELGSKFQRYIDFLNMEELSMVCGCVATHR